MYDRFWEIMEFNVWILFGVLGSVIVVFFFIGFDVEVWIRLKMCVSISKLYFFLEIFKFWEKFLSSFDE